METSARSDGPLLRVSIRGRWRDGTHDVRRRILQEADEHELAALLAESLGHGPATGLTAAPLVAGAELAGEDVDYALWLAVGREAPSETGVDEPVAPAVAVAWAVVEALGGEAPTSVEVEVVSPLDGESSRRRLWSTGLWLSYVTGPVAPEIPAVVTVASGSPIPEAAVDRLVRTVSQETAALPLDSLTVSDDRRRAELRLSLPAWDRQVAGYLAAHAAHAHDGPLTATVARG
ncbi:hypothetical protein [Nocardioides lijunqiniae]|uniref:hypothetical protein n=1 Tax=Nocardioides lijunqiniae TaxID=2760832 RepID=UPI001877C238|nr:hypothetical protein [Nocardioides lijunqiniae]